MVVVVGTEMSFSLGHLVELEIYVWAADGTSIGGGDDTSNNKGGGKCDDNVSIIANLT